MNQQREDSAASRSYTAFIQKYCTEKPGVHDGLIHGEEGGRDALRVEGGLQLLQLSHAYTPHIGQAILRGVP